ncbi:EpsG family protein [Sphingosinicella sp. BN140058]|uniref:EpsG family protein n=1 Tax=Sphingosinicella sp. BN140058 TaxID=1892855 RepID=UPI0010137DEC|nr:EpsG family protein [Sphingosinicella sp. BN140058]QAY77821.1 EpsG family protein [Sphingosinicella sp. BN140058]
MLIYLWLLLVPLALAGAPRLPERLGRLVYWAAAVALILFIGLRREIGCDWDPYMVLLRIATILPPQEAIVQADPAYMLLNIAVAKTGFAIGIVNLLCAALFVTGLLLFVRKQPLPHLAFLMALPVLIMVAGLSATRQSVALGLCLWALASLVGGARRLPWLLFLSAGLFHWTAFVLLPLAGLVPFADRRLDRVLVLLGLGAGLALALSMWLIPGLSALIPAYKASGGAIFRASLNGLALIVFVAGRRHLQMSGEERLIGAYLSALALFAFALMPSSETAADRLGFYIVPLQMLVLARLPLAVAVGRRRLIAQLVVAAPVLILFGGWIAMTSAKACYVPYRNFLSAPSSLRASGRPLPRPTAQCAAWLADPRPFVANGGLVRGEHEPRTLSGESRRARRMCLQLLAMRYDLDLPGQPCANSMFRPSDLRAAAKLPKAEGRRRTLVEAERCLAAMRPLVGVAPANRR